MTIDDFAAGLVGVECSANGQFSSCCPAHDDNNASLSFRAGDAGKIVVNCKAGCAAADVLAKYPRGPLTFRDLILDPSNNNGFHGNGHAGNGATNGKPKLGPIVKTYDYVDENGRLLMQVTRHDPKTFRQRKPNGSGGWDWKTADVRKIPFRLPDLIAADPAAPVFIVEGEKDCLRLESLGILATTNPGGAGKWGLVDVEAVKAALGGRHVAVIADNDAPGAKHAADVVARLKGIAAAAVIIELPGLPDHGDVSDWLDAGGTADELLHKAANLKANPQGRCNELDEWRNSQGPDSSQEPRADAGGGVRYLGAQGMKVTNQGIGERTDNDGKTKKFPYPLPINEIIGHAKGLTGDWPRKAYNDLFAVGDDVHWLHSPAALFGFFSAATGETFNWSVKSSSAISKSELFAEWKRTATNYVAVESLPHEPQMDGHFYIHKTPEPGDGKALQTLLDFYSYETLLDRDLLQALVVTLFWGGAAGSRPAFAITSKHGRGAGKSKGLAAFGHLVGGSIDIGPKEDMGAIKLRLLSPEATSKRLVVLDNLKSFRFSCAELEALLTTTTISGRRLYVGEAQRPNTMLYGITVNGVSFSADMAQRCIIIEIGKPSYDDGWFEGVVAFIDQNRTAIIADVVAFIRQEPKPLRRYSRWGSWEKAILSKLADPDAAQALVLDRQGTADIDHDEIEIIEEYFRQQLTTAGFNADADRVHIPSAVVGEWHNAATNERVSVIGASRKIGQFIDEGKSKRLMANPCRTNGRGLLWIGETSDGSTAPDYGLEARLDAAKQAKRGGGQW